MRIYIGILLIVISSVLFTVLLPQNTPWIYVTGPLFVIGFGFIQSKIHEMGEDIVRLKEELNEFIKGVKNGKIH